jgi:hypothetical protein
LAFQAIEALAHCAAMVEAKGRQSMTQGTCGMSRRRKKKRCFMGPKLRLLAVLCCSLSLPALAQDQAERIRSLEQRLSESLMRIEALSARLEQLERAAAPPSSPPAPPVSPASAPGGNEARAIATLQEDMRQISRGLSQRRENTGLQLHGFADVGGAWSSREDPLRLRGFNVGTFDLYLTPQLGDRVKSLVELAFEYTQDEGVEFDLERIQIAYSVSDALTLWAGRFHTPFGYWNTAFHHGANLQTSISRPHFLDFEDRGGVLPVHSVGIWGTGKTRLGQGRLVYDAYLTNGPRISDGRLDFNAFNDDNSGKMLGGSLAYEPGGALSGVTVGVHGFGTSVDAYASDGAVLRRTSLRMVGGLFNYNERGWEVIGEYYHFSNADATTDSRRSSRLWFVQFGKTIDALTPFARIERSSLDPDDYYFASQREARSYRRVAVGARYSLEARAALKVELSHTAASARVQFDEMGAPIPNPAVGYRRAAIQYSIAF